MTERLHKAASLSQHINNNSSKGKEFVDDKLSNLTKSERKISERKIKKNNCLYSSS